MMRVFTWTVLCAACTSGLAAEQGTPSAEAEQLKRRWTRFHQTPARMGVRDLFGFVLDATSANWDPERTAAVLALAEQMQDRDPDSRTYGNFKQRPA